MSLSQDQMMDLMQYADGELGPKADPADGEERSESRKKLLEIEALVAKNPEARAFLDEMARLGAWVETAEPLTVPAAAKFDAADSIMDAIDAASGEGDAKVANEKAAAEERAAKRPAAATPELPRVTSLDVAREKRRRVGVMIATAVALAAGIALVMRTPANGDGHATASIPKKVDVVVPAGHPTNSPPASSEASQAVANAVNPSGDNPNGNSGVEVNVSDSTQNGVSVFYLPGSNAASASAVVWIDDSSGGKK